MRPLTLSRRAALLLAGACLSGSGLGSCSAREPGEREPDGGARPSRLDAQGTPWAHEVHRADAVVRGRWSGPAGPRPVRVRWCEDLQEYLASGGSAEAPGVTVGLRVGRAEEGESAAGTTGHEDAVMVLLHPEVAALSENDRALVLRHELVHARFDQEIPRSEPRWWREGLAEHLAHDQPAATGEPVPENGREALYARGRRAVDALAAADDALLPRLDAAWGTSELPGPRALPDWLAAQGVPHDTIRSVEQSTGDQAH